MKNIKALSTLCLLFLSLTIFAQRPALRFVGTVKQNNAPLAGVRVYIMDSGGITSEALSDAKGKFEVKSFYNKILLIHFEKEGCISLHLYASTRLVGVTQEEMEMKMVFAMYAQPKGALLKFEEPVSKIAYDYTNNKFDYDQIYEKESQGKLKALMAQESLPEGEMLNAMPANKKVVIGYLPNWAAYKRNHLFNPSTIDYSKYTILDYSFFHPDENGIIKSCDEMADKMLLDLDHNVVDRAHQQGVKVMVSVGGWSLSNKFSAVAADSLKRLVFANECIRLMKKYDFDGVDIDWEFPASKRTGGHKEDTKNYTLFLRDLRHALDSYGKEVHKKMLLTAAVGAGAEHFETINWAEVAPLLDYVNLMSYAYNGVWSDRAAHNAPLRVKKDSTGDCIERSVNLLVNKNKVPLNKINVGLSFYGKAIMFPEGKAALGSNAHLHKSDSTSYFYKTKGTPPYFDVLMHKQYFDEYWDDVAKVPYLISKDKSMFVSFDNEKSVQLKCEYVNTIGAAGVIIWEISNDFVESETESGKVKNTPLADMAAKVLNGK